MSNITRAITLADEWLELKKHRDYRSAVALYFVDATPHELVAMWQTGKTADGRELKAFENEALVEAWCRTFGELPPCDGDEVEDPALLHAAIPADDTVLDASEVVRLTGVSLSTLKRMVIAGRFPKPQRISERQIGWPAREVKDWLAELERRPPNARV